MKLIRITSFLYIFNISLLIISTFISIVIGIPIRFFIGISCYYFMLVNFFLYNFYYARKEDLSYKENILIPSPHVLDLTFGFFQILFFFVSFKIIKGNSFLEIIYIYIWLISGLLAISCGINFIIFVRYYNKTTQVTISDASINIYIQNRLYLQFRWNEIKKIKIYYLIYHLGYKIEVIQVKDFKLIRLFLIIKRKKTQKLIVENLKNHSMKLKLPYIERVSEKQDIHEEIKQELKAIRDFIKNG